MFLYADICQTLCSQRTLNQALFITNSAKQRTGKTTEILSHTVTNYTNGHQRAAADADATYGSRQYVDYVSIELL